MIPSVIQLAFWGAMIILTLVYVARMRSKARRNGTRIEADKLPIATLAVVLFGAFLGGLSYFKGWMAAVASVLAFIAAFTVLTILGRHRA